MRLDIDTARAPGHAGPVFTRQSRRAGDDREPPRGDVLEARPRHRPGGPRPPTRGSRSRRAADRVSGAAQRSPAGRGREAPHRRPATTRPPPPPPRPPPASRTGPRPDRGGHVSDATGPRGCGRNRLPVGGAEYIRGAHRRAPGCGPRSRPTRRARRTRPVTAPGQPAPPHMPPAARPPDGVRPRGRCCSGRRPPGTGAPSAASPPVQGRRRGQGSGPPSGGNHGGVARAPRPVDTPSVSRERWKAVAEALGQHVDPVLRRANLLISGVDLENSRGNILRVGSGRLRVNGETRPCERMDEQLPGWRAELRHRWGGRRTVDARPCSPWNGRQHIDQPSVRHHRYLKVASVSSFRSPSAVPFR